MPKPDVLAIAVAGVLASLAVAADTPPEPKDTAHRACSLNGRWCVEWQESSPGPTRVETVRVTEHPAEKKGNASWSTSFRISGSLAVTNDGACVIDLATSSNLLPDETKPDDPAFVFHCKDSTARVLSLRQFITDFESLPRSTTHRVWAESFGLDEHDRLVVNTKEGRTVLIDPHTGKPVQGSYAH
jgi:hypothetical protein